MDLDLFLDVNAPDPRFARVVSVADLSALPLPVLQYSDRLNLNIYLVSAVNTYHADSTDVTLARSLALGVRGQLALAQTIDFTAIANGYRCSLDLTSTALALLLRSAREGSLSLVHTTTGTGPNRTRRCSLDCTVLGDVEAVDDGTTLDPDTYYTAAEVEALFSARAAGYHASANASGVTTITPNTGKNFHTEVVTLSGAAGTRSLVLATANRAAGDRIVVLCDIPATPDIVVNFYSGDTSGDPIATETTDDSADDLAAEFVYTGSAWRRARIDYPA